MAVSTRAPRAVAPAGRLRPERTQITAALVALVGAALVFLLAPNLSNKTRAFAFEAPPDPLTVSFRPPTLVTVIGIVFVVAAVASLVPVVPTWFTRGLRLVAAALTIPLVLAVGLALSDAPSTNVLNLLAESLVLATPIALGSMTGLWCERAGIVNIGIEGMMLSGAGVGFLSYSVLGQASGAGWLWFSILVAVLVGGLLALLHAVLCIRYHVNQIISGVVINLFALGITGFLRSQVIVPSGHATGTGTSEIGIPLLANLPIVGKELFQGKPIYFTMYGVVFLTWLVMFRTRWGLRVRSCGENPHAAETLGIDVVTVRYQAVVLGGFIAGLAGAWFSLEAQARFEDNMTNAAGFIALAALIFGKWRPWGAFGGAILFGFSRALGSRLQFLKVAIGSFPIPSEFFQSLPFIVTLVVVAGALGRALPPAAEGQPFHRST
jgi:general nucleoside transport system permease protein